MYTGEQFNLAIKKMQDSVIKIYNKATEANVPNDLIVKELLDLDLNQTIGKEMNGQLELLMTQYAVELKKMQSFADISETLIESLIRTALIVYQNKIKYKIDVMKKLKIE